MKFKAFILGLLASFGLPWLLAIVIPFSAMRNLEPVEYAGIDIDGGEGVYIPKRDGRITEGSLVYGQEGCYYCHSQLIRPTYAGSDVWRADWAGLKKTADHDDTRRETLASDYDGEKIAHIGVMRVGHDLSNLGRRLQENLKGDDEPTPEMWVYLHLYNPRGVTPYRDDSQDLPVNSVCPSKGGLFKEIAQNLAGAEALPVDAPEGIAIVPTDRARNLVSYLVSLKKDTLEQPVPKSLNFNPSQPAAQ